MLLKLILLTEVNKTSCNSLCGIYRLTHAENSQIRLNVSLPRFPNRRDEICMHLEGFP